jgi:hypothetical protein
MLSFKNAIYLMLEVIPEVSELNEFEKILKNTTFDNPYDKKRAKKDYDNLLELRYKINATLPKDAKPYEWLNKITNANLVDMFKSQELLRNIVIFMNAGIQELKEE